jgi:hypothetical protein
MAAMSEKYADTINSSETFDWSQYWDFREAKADAITTCDEILNYDESICSKEYQICVDECKSMAFQIEAFFNTVSKEMDVNALSVLTQNLSNVVTVGMNNASVYQTMATVAYMEANDGDQAKIQELKQKVADNYIYQATTGAGNSASGAGQSALQKIVFTNDYGTSTTKCAHASCTNAIATSGDTNCCIIHSNKCFNCSKYVDEDTMFCTSCEALSSKGSSDASSDSSSDTCRYQYPNGTVCGDAAIRGMVLCPTHFTELYKIYRSLHGK